MFLVSTTCPLCEGAKKLHDKDCFRCKGKGSLELSEFEKRRKMIVVFLSQRSPSEVELSHGIALRERGKFKLLRGGKSE